MRLILSKVHRSSRMRILAGYCGSMEIYVRDCALRMESKRRNVSVGMETRNRKSFNKMIERGNRMKNYRRSIYMGSRWSSEKKDEDKN